MNNLKLTTASSPSDHDEALASYRDLLGSMCGPCQYEGMRWTTVGPKASLTSKSSSSRRLPTRTHRRPTARS